MRYLFIILFLSGFPGHAQMLDNTEGQTFGEVPFFNEDFVKRNKIRSIKGYYSTKATLDYIRESNDIYYYEFNEEGQLIKDYRTQFGDTLISMYTYDEQGRLKQLRKSDNGGFHSYYYTYDSKNRILEREYRRDVNKSGDKLNFDLDQTFIVSVEKFEYVDFDNGDFKKIYFNSTGKPYKDEFFYFEENGYLIAQEGRLRMGSGQTKTSYVYDERGRVVEKKIETRVMGNYSSKWTYEYDAYDNVMAQHYYKNDKYLTEDQIVYEEKTLLLEAIVTREEENNFVTILHFTDYTFFE